jgi:hypothetical protein
VFVTLTVTPVVDDLRSLEGPSVQAVVNRGTGAIVLARFRDLEATASGGDPYTAMITWGDGTSSAGQVVQYALTDFRVVASHTYTAIGQYPVTVEVSKQGLATTLNLVGTAQVAVDEPPMAPPVSGRSVAGSSSRGGTTVPAPAAALKKRSRAMRIITNRTATVAPARPVAKPASPTPRGPAGAFGRPRSR